MLTLAVLAWLFARASRESEGSERLIELARARGVVLHPGRARRAVGAGQEPRLRERLDAPRG